MIGFVFWVALAWQLAWPQPADLILRNGKIVTLENDTPVVPALASRGDRIIALGSEAKIRALAGPKTKVIDLKGALAIPGFIEGHGHFMGVGQFKRSLNLRDAKNWDEIVALVAAAAKEAQAGEWILGRGFHQSKWDRPPAPNVQGFPVHDQLSAVSPNNPVVLTHASGHASMVNQKALELAGINARTKDPEGGEILRDAQGRPTGLLNERAQALVRKAYAAYLAARTPEQRQADAIAEAKLAAQEAISHGITSFQDAGSSFETIDLLSRLSQKGDLPLRLWVMLRVPNQALREKGLSYRRIDKFFTVRAIKRAADGALGPRGAWLLEPYSDLPDRTGMNVEPMEEIEETARWALAHGFQLCVHAIGDRGNRETLNVFEKVFRDHPSRRDLRWRIEHAQHLAASDIPRFAKLGVIASMQAIHCTSDAPYVLARLGPARAQEGAYVWRKLLDSKAVVINGTDAPVEEIDPIACFYASVTRRLKDGSYFYPEQKMTRMEALRSYTRDAAFAAFEENMKGSLKPGKLADITVLSKDILTVPDAEILQAKVLYTIVGGKVVYQGLQ
ncbi:MAG: amidohydrolase [Bryobacteraceae bacterium]|nr:amidohydrolase [Bryobacteraceae bacterium]MDW8376582.1 amidohydrolase [Bryobacterales bacterium]